MPVCLPALSGNDLLAWVAETADGWRQLVTSHPEVLELACDIRETHSVAELLQHIVAVELRYAERLAGLPVTAYEAIPFRPVSLLFDTHARALSLFRSLATQEEPFWSEPIDLATRSSGTLRSTRAVVFQHALLHSIRHYAQLATLVRRAGVAPSWAMDYLFRPGATS